MSDAVFWKWATLMLPVAIAIEVALFGAVASAITNSDPTADPSRHLIFGVVVIAAAAAAALLARRRTSAGRGAALGVVTACGFLLLTWVVTL
ncbi:hypothetical protein AB0N05_13845 [Nocardia sp. NPDC051030]|uniref:hypothetical protein n=1 Tax=Nocardia sp. NPDC051030 TaxID=3155162 RepID=UPI0034455A4F